MLITTLVLGLILVILGIIELVSPHSLINISKITDTPVISANRLMEILDKNHSTDKVAELLDKEIDISIGKHHLKYSRFVGTIILIVGIILCINYVRFR